MTEERATPFRFEVTMKPPADISPNASTKIPPGKAAGIKAKWKRAWWDAILIGLAEEQGDGYEVTLPSAPLFTGACHVEMIYQRGRGASEWDGDNLLAVCKWGIDQLQEAGIVANDRQLRYWPIAQVKGTVTKLTVILVPDSADPALMREARMRAALEGVIDLISEAIAFDLLSANTIWYERYREVLSGLESGDIDWAARSVARESLRPAPLKPGKEGA